VDVTGTFAALQGTEVISNQLAILSAPGEVRASAYTNNIVDKGNRPETNFIVEMVFAPTLGTDQGVGQNNNYADIFSIGSIYYSDANHSDAVFVLGYTSPTTYRLGMDALLGTGANSTGGDLPARRCAQPYCAGDVLGPSRTNNLVRYYLNGNLIVEDVAPDNGASASVGSVYATFGQAVPGSSFIPRGPGWDSGRRGVLNFSGVFSPGSIPNCSAASFEHCHIRQPAHAVMARHWLHPSTKHHREQPLGLGRCVRRNRKSNRYQCSNRNKVLSAPKAIGSMPSPGRPGRK